MNGRSALRSSDDCEHTKVSKPSGLVCTPIDLGGAPIHSRRTTIISLFRWVVWVYRDTGALHCYDWITCIRNDTSDISTNSTARATLALWFAPCLLDGFTAIRGLKQSTSFRGCNRI